MAVCARAGCFAAFLPRLIFALLLLAGALSCAPAHAAIAFRAASSNQISSVAVTLRGTGNVVAAQSGNVSVPLPPLTVGDFLLCIVEQRDNVVSTMPAGWTQLNAANGNSTHRAALFWKFAARSESAPTITHTGGSKIIAQMMAFNGVDPTNPFDVTNSFTLNSNGLTTTAASITTVTANAMLVFTGHLALNYGNLRITAGGSLTQAFSSGDNSGSANAQIVAYYATRAAGVQAAVTLTRSNPTTNADSHGALIALRPVTSGLSVAVPSGTQSGDVMVAAIGVRPSSTTITAPAGWTLLRNVVQPANGTASNTMSTYYRVAGSSEPSYYTWTLGSPGSVEGAVGSISSFSGVDNASPINIDGANTATSVQQSGNPTYTANSVTTTVTNTMVVAVHAFPSGSTMTPPSGMTEIVDNSSLVPLDQLGMTMEMSYVAQAAAGATGNKTATGASTGSDEDGIAALIALRTASTGPNHYRVQNNATGVNCQAENITITAHDASHNAVTLTNSTTITVTAVRVSGAGAGNKGDWSLVTGGGTLSNGTADDGVATYTFAAGGESSIVLALKDTWAQTVNVSVTDGTATDTSGTASADSGYNQDLTFNAAGFRFIDASNSVIPTQVAGVTSSSLTLQAIDSTSCGATGACTGVCTVPSAFGNGATVAVDLASECVNPTTCQAGKQVSITNNGTTAISANNASSVTSYTSKSLVFGSNGQASFTLNYTDVGSIRLYARYNIPLGTGGSSSTNMTGSSNAFVVKPYSFVVSNVKRTSDNFANPAAATATGTAFIAAGNAFTATVTAVNSSGVATPNYGKETTPESARLISTLASGLGLTNNPAITNPTAFGSFASGAATGTTFAWDEVGIITLSAGVGDSDYLGAGDVSVFTQSGNVGRFIPHHFAMSGASLTNRSSASCSPASSFTYMGEPFALQYTLTALNAGGTTTQNYATTNSFAKLPTTPTTASPASTLGYGAVNGTTDLTSRLDLSTTNSITWTLGVATVNATLALSRAASPDGPYSTLKVGIAPSDQDAVGLQSASFDLDVDSTGGNEHALVGTTAERFGRLRLYNATGTQLSDLPVPLELQYYNGIGFVTNAADSCTTLSRTDVTFGNFQRNLSACETGLSSPPATITFTSGKATLMLSKPGTGSDGNAGSVDLTANLSAAASGNSCINAASVAGTAANKTWLQGNWGGSATYGVNPSARAAFGLSRQASEFIFLRENY